MRVLFLTQYYPPETGACQNRIRHLAHALSQSGHEITLLTALPNYPAGRVFEQYRGKLFVAEHVDQVRILRTWLYTTSKIGFVRRLLCYWSFALFAFFAGLLRTGSLDIIITESPPLFLGITGLLLSWLKGAKHVFNISDLWPESAVAMQVIRNPLLIKAAVRLEEFLYQRSDLITGQTRGIVNDIRPRSDGVRVALLTNGVDPEEFANISGVDRERVRAEFGIRDEFVVGYFGLHGLGQGLITALHAGSILRDNPKILFVFFGDGPEKEALMLTAERFGLRNVRFCAPQPAHRVPDIMQAVDASLVPLKNLPLFHGALPSKLFTSMGAGIPVLASLDGEAREVIRAAQAGLCVEPENPRALADAILHLAADPELCRRLGQNGFRFVRQHYDRQHIADEFQEILLGIDTRAVLPKSARLGQMPRGAAMVKNLSQTPTWIMDILLGYGEPDAPDTASDLSLSEREAWSKTDAGLGLRLSIITGLQVLVSFAMQWYVVAQLGAGVQTDALYAGNTLPQVVTSLGIDTLTFVLVPLLAPKSKKELFENGWQLLIGILSVFSVLALMLHLAMPLLTPILVPGLSAQGRALATSLSRVQILSIIGSASFAVLSALYQVRNRFIRPLLSMLIANILGIILLAWKIHVYGVVLVAWVQVFIVTLPTLMQLRILGRFSRFRFDFSLLRQAFRQMKPLVYGAMYYRTNFIVDRLLASFLAPGSIVILDLAQRVQAAIVRILNQGIVTPIIPSLAKMAEVGNWRSFRSLYRRKSLEMLLTNCALVAIVAFVLIAHPKLGTIFPTTHFIGNLTPETVNRLLVVFLYMSGVMLGGSLNHTLMNSYYAAGNTVTPTKIGVATYTIGIGMKLAGFFLMGLTGIALAISISTLIQSILLFGYLRPHRLTPFKKRGEQGTKNSYARKGRQIPAAALPKARQQASDV